MRDQQSAAPHTSLLTPTAFQPLIHAPRQSQMAILVTCFQTPDFQTLRAATYFGNLERLYIWVIFVNLSVVCLHVNDVQVSSPCSRLEMGKYLKNKNEDDYEDEKEDDDVSGHEDEKQDPSQNKFKIHKLKRIEIQS